MFGNCLEVLGNCLQVSSGVRGSIQALSGSVLRYSETACECLGVSGTVWVSLGVFKNSLCGNF